MQLLGDPNMLVYPPTSYIMAKRKAAWLAVMAAAYLFKPLNWYLEKEGEAKVC